MFIQSAILRNWDSDGDSLSWILTGFFSGIFIFDFVANIIEYKNSPNE